MSSAFTKDSDDGGALPDPGERLVSMHRNLVTRKGLAMIETEIAAHRGDMSKAEAAGDREKMALAARDLRYWTARRETAEISEPDEHNGSVRFGMTVTLRDDHEKTHQWTIVGEDEADAKLGTISHVSPMALALFGKRPPEVVAVNGREWEIVAIGVRE